ncbi:MAG: LytTR family DNA-binding domain-containing protein [Pseudomonadota bacterium]
MNPDQPTSIAQIDTPTGASVDILASPAPANPAARDLLARYQPWRRIVEPGFWIVLLCFEATMNSMVTWLDLSRSGLGFAAWEPVVWELSSNLVVLALIPVILVFERRYPLQLTTWRQNWRFHLAASVVFCLLHVSGMVALRKLVYLLAGYHYDFGGWMREIGYEYLKDVRAYASILAGVALYRLFLLRLQGEARLLEAPEAGPPEGSIEHPERFLVRKLGKEFLLPAAEVEWLQAWGNYVNLRVRAHDYPLRTTMAAIEGRLDASRFVRVHRSYIVNLDYIQEIVPLDSGDARATMRDGSQVPISRRFRDNLRKLSAA